MPDAMTNKKLRWPLDKIFVTQRFGVNPSLYVKYGMKGHNGIDFRTRFIDSPLAHRYALAADAGEVAEVNLNTAVSGYGIFVRMQHADGSQTIYAHLTKTYVVVGQKVSAGGVIGLTGNTGDSTGPHLHFGYRPPGWLTIYGDGFKGYIDPMPMFQTLKTNNIISTV